MAQEIKSKEDAYAAAFGYKDRGKTSLSTILAAGYKGVPTFNFANLKNKASVAGPNSVDNIPTIDDTGIVNTDFNKSSSELGTPYFMPCKLDDFQLPNEPLIEIRGMNNIIKTPIDGNEGTFKEKWSLGDYVVRIRGIAMLETNSDAYPEAQIRAIRALIEKQEDVKVVNNLCAYFGIYNLAIENWDFPALEGAPGMQPYELHCLSDSFFDLTLLERTI
jgi:hypothetical protein